MKPDRNNGILPGESVVGVGGKPTPRPSYAFTIDDDTPAPLAPMKPYRDDRAALEMLNLVALLPAIAGVVVAVVFFIAVLLF